MNKKRSIIFAFFVFLVGFYMTSCKKQTFLDKTVTTDLYEHTVFSDSVNAMDFLTALYIPMNISFDPQRFGNSGLESCTDEAQIGSGSLGSQAVLWNKGLISAANVTSDPWDICYQNIRRANLFLKHLPEAPFSFGQKWEVEGEARFLRAWYYFILLKTYGGIPLIGDTVYSSSDDLSPRRNTFSDCVEYIVSECDAARDLVLETQFTSEYGRITKGACLALKSRVLLYAASPLFNGGGESNDLLTQDPDLKEIVGYPAYDRERWKRAADAAREVMNMNLYSLADYPGKPGLGFDTVFFVRDNNPEYILPYMQPSNSTLERLWGPSSRGGISPNTAFPIEDFVNAFPMKNGLPITDPSSGYDPRHPYDNRDPRFGYSVTHNESLMVARLDLDNLYPVYTYFGATDDGLGTSKGTVTGYFVQKMTSNRVAAGNILSSKSRILPLIRYAEILLNYAEAVNEYSGPTPEVYDMLDSIRRRAGIDPGMEGLYGIKANLNKDQMREVIHKERRIELAFEEHRFWDVRRWKIADKTDNGPVSGMKIIRQGADYLYNSFVMDERVFRDRMYLWPLPRVEIAKSLDLLQNPDY